MADKTITDIANDVTAELGSKAAAMIHARVLYCIRSGDRNGATFWAKLGGAVRAMLGERSEARRQVTDQPRQPGSL